MDSKLRDFERRYEELDGAPGNTIKLLSTDNKLVEVDILCASLSPVLHKFTVTQFMLNPEKMISKLLHLPSVLFNIILQYYCFSLEVNADGRTLLAIVNYLEHHKGHELLPISKPLRSKEMRDVVRDLWDAKFIDSLPTGLIKSVTLTSHELGIAALYDLCCAKIASLLKRQPIERYGQILTDLGFEFESKVEFQFYESLYGIPFDEAKLRIISAQKRVLEFAFTKTPHIGDIVKSFF